MWHRGERPRLIGDDSTVSAVRRGFRSMPRPAYHRPKSPQAPHVSRIGPIEAGLAPLASSNTLMNVKTVNCPRNISVFEVVTATICRRAPGRDSPDGFSCAHLRQHLGHQDERHHRKARPAR